jgi:hypothetical protein
MIAASYKPGYGPRIPVRQQPTLRSIVAKGKREERAEQKRLRELERRAKDQTKLSAIEQSRLEVETFDNALEIVLSIHKEQGAVWDWHGLAATLPFHRPIRHCRHEFNARARFKSWLGSEEGKKATEEALARDLCEHEEALKAHSEALAEQSRLRNFARRILAGDEKAYTECLVEFGSFEEISALGSYVHFTVHSRQMVECKLKVNGAHVIPSELKSLNSSGKMSVKPMPKARFHELYQDYVCGCVLRVAREVFAILPADHLLITASVDALDSDTGHTPEMPVLSVGFPRQALTSLDFERLDPSDAVQSFLHRGDFKKSRKSGQFEGITPLSASEILDRHVDDLDLGKVLTLAEEVRAQMKEEIRLLKLG